MKEMVGGCCVCSDDRGWTENPLVYCDGQGCTVAVHQACYGIETVPSGPWFCRKCESQERAARVRCDLCPSKDGALKRTDTTTGSGWAHVVCALYIPEVRFGNVTTMEPIILSRVPTDRYNKSCYICESQGREAKSKIGACMNCNKPGCKHHFHVTCAQAMGLLCEEAGNLMDNVKYCGYCQHHYSKLKKGANLKTIPAFRPLPPAGASAESTPEKLNPPHGGSNWSGQRPSGASSCNGSKEKTRKKPGRKSSSQVSPKAGNSRDSTSSSVIVEGPNAGEDSKMKSSKNEVIPFANVLAGVGLVPGPRVTMNDQSNSGADRHEFNDTAKQENARNNTEPIKSSGLKKLEKSNEGLKSLSSTAPVPVEVPTMTNASDKNRSNSRRKSSTRCVTPISQGGNDTESTTSNVSDPGLTSAPEPFMKSEQCIKVPPVVKVEPPIVPETNPPVVHSVIVSSATALQSESTQVQSSQSVPQRSVSPLTISTSAAAGGSSQVQSGVKLNYSHMIYQNTSKESDRPLAAVPAKKPRRGRAPKVNAPVAPDSPPSSPDSAGVGAEQPPKRRKKASKNPAPIDLDSEGQHLYQAAISHAGGFLSAQQIDQHPEAMLRRDYPSINQLAKDNTTKVEPTVLPSIGMPSSSISVGMKDLNSHKDNTSISSVGKENNLYIRNGIIAPHMLGNQLNPNSSVAQKMTDTLAAELLAHSVTNQASPVGSANLTGVPFPVRVVSPSLKTNVPSSSGIPSFPQSLEQLLERQWEQGSQFLMEQAQHFDIASLLSVLHNLRQENMRLEDHVMSLNRRRDHLLAVQARLSIPLSAVQSSHMVPTYPNTNTNLPDRSTPGTVHPSGLQRASPQERERNSRGTPYLPQMENGIGMSEHLSAYMGAAFSSPHGSHRSSASSSHQSDRVVPSPVIVSSRMNTVYPSGGAISVSSTMSPVQGSSSFMGMAEGRNLTVLRSPSSTPEMRPEVARNTMTPSQQPPYTYQIVSPPLSASTHPGSYSSITSAMSNVGNNQHNMNARRDVPDSRHPLGRPSSIDRRQ